MEKETLKNIFNFLEEKEGKKSKHKYGLKWKLTFNEPLNKEYLNVKGNLDLKYSEITSLPEGLKVGGWMSLGSSKIESLPEGLEVGGDFNLMYTELNSLPKGLKVGGILYIYKSPLKEYTDNELREMIKPGFIEGDIYRG